MYKKKTKINYLAMFMAFVMLFTFIVPLVASTAFAEEGNKEEKGYGIKITSTGDTEKFFGSKYEVRKIAELDEDGKEIPLEEPIITQAITTKEAKGVFISTDNNSVYEIELLEPAKGFVAKEDEVYRFEFPIMEDGKIKNEIIYEMTEKIETDFFTAKVKKVDEEGTPLSNVEFEFEGQKHTTDENGEFEIKQVEMGNYTLKELATLDGYVKIEDDIELDFDYNAEREKMIIVSNDVDGVEVEGNVITVTNKKVEKPPIDNPPPTENPPGENPPGKNPPEKVKTMDIKSKETIIPIVLVVLLLVLAVGYFIVKKKDDKENKENLVE